MIKQGEKLHYLDGSGNILDVVSGSNERNGRLILLTPHQELHDISTFNVFRTLQAAQIAREGRKGARRER